MYYQFEPEALNDQPNEMFVHIQTHSNQFDPQNYEPHGYNPNFQYPTSHIPISESYEHIAYDPRYTYPTSYQMYDQNYAYQIPEMKIEKPATTVKPKKSTKGSKTDCPCIRCQSEIRSGILPTTKSHHSCPVDGCSKTYPKPQHLKAHVTWHDKDRIHRCPVCKEKFQGTAILEVHLREHTARGERAKAQLKRKRMNREGTIAKKNRYQ